MEMCNQGLRALSVTQSAEFEGLRQKIKSTALARLKAEDSIDHEEEVPVSEWPEQGSVRRELYPWNHWEPDRFSEESLRELNEEMQKVAPNLEVRSTKLPALSSATSQGTNL
jgi:hypothetical protein